VKVELIVSTKPAGGVTEAVIASVVRLERMRIFGTLGILAVCGLGALTFDSKLPSMVAGICFVVIGCLGFGWLRAVRRAGASARALTGPTTLTLTDDTIGITGSGRDEALAWKQLMHGTETDAGWLFVAKRSHAAFLIPRSDLSIREIGELNGFLSTWPKRRMRHMPPRR
jgi:hypothetical protein